MPQDQELVPFASEVFPLGTIKPSGWIRHEIEASARGLAGHLFYFYRFVNDSTWLGGTHEYSGLNEAAPYWYNYIVPLAYSVVDDTLAIVLQKQADHFLDYTLDHQAADGWLGPETEPQTRGIWARCLLLQGMINHAQAQPARYEIITKSILRFARLVHTMLLDNYTGYLPKPDDLFDPQWFGVARAHELSLSFQWLYEIAEDNDDKTKIWEVMELLWKGSAQAGRDWTEFFTEEAFPKNPSVKGEALNFQHGVNVAQGLRYPAQYFRMHPSESSRVRCFDSVDMAFRYHGTTSGSLSSDEYVGGLSPRRGTEICCTVELMFTLQYLHRLFDHGDFADDVERAAFNALPAAISSDWWSHQYVTQINQPSACELELKEGEKSPWYDVCKYASVFGLEPEFPCCTVNHPTALPKLLMGAFLQLQGGKSPDVTEDGILHAYLIPSRLETSDINIECETTYPYSPLIINYSISTKQPFNFYIRRPKWATDHSTISFGDHTYPFAPKPSASDSSTSNHHIRVPSSKAFKIEVKLHSTPRYHISHNTVAVYNGALLYALSIPSTSTTSPPRNYKDQRSTCPEVAEHTTSAAPWMRHVRDHQLSASAHWGYALDPSFPLAHVPLETQSASPWAAGGAEYIEARGVRVAWPVSQGTPVDPTLVDVPAGAETEILRLVPYGGAKLHMAQFPIVKAYA